MILGKPIYRVTAALLLGATASLGQAADFTVNTAQTNTNAGLGFSNNDTLTVTSGGSIRVTTGEAVSGEVSFFTLTNNGTLSATNAVPPVFPPFATAGIAFLGTNNTIINNGTISSSDFTAVVVVRDNTTVTNAGTISGGQDGIGLNGANARVTNSGTITATLDGIYIRGDGANVNNSGTITANDDGIDTSGDNDVIVNSGTITAARDGIETSGTGVTVTNSGVVVGASDAYDLNGDNSTLNLEFGSRSEGLFSFDGLNGTLNIGAGINAAYTTDGGNPTTINSARNAYVQDGNRIFALNLDQGFNSLSQSASFASGLHSTAQGQSLGNGIMVTQGLSVAKPGPWFQLSTDYAQNLGDSNSAGYTSRSGQITAGFALSDRLGFFVSANSARSKLSNSFETDSSTQALGLYGTIPLEDGDLNWSLSAGRTSNNGQRIIQTNTVAGGFETATSNYTQDFVAPTISYATRLQPGLMLDLELGYVQLTTAAYSETGATNNATFAARTTHVTSFTPKISWTTIDSPIPFDMSAGVQFRSYSGDPVNVTIGAANGSFSDYDNRIEARAFVSGRVEYPLNNGWKFTGFGEAGYSSFNTVNLSADLVLSRSF
jgi:hypothetical protein